MTTKAQDEPSPRSCSQRHAQMRGSPMILVTGGAGFIGSNIVAALCGRGAPVAVCDALGD
ncbi:MAG: NAD-dependent epimerase/dehydratase family protein, partial [Rhodanobacteraceae bacterium]